MVMKNTKQLTLLEVGEIHQKTLDLWYKVMASAN